MNEHNGDLPRGWVAATLGDLGEYHNGRAFKKDEWAETGRPIIRIQNLTDPSKPYNYFQGDAEPRHEVEAGDLLVSWAATLDVFQWNGPPAVLNQHIFKVISFIDPQFHFYVLKHAVDALYAQSHGVGMVHVTRGRFDATPVLLPPMDEQQRIVIELSRQLARVGAGETNLGGARRALRTYRESVLTAAVSGQLVANDFDDPPAEELIASILSRRQARWAAAGLGRHKEPEPPTALDIDLPHGWASATVDQLAVGVQYGSSAKTSADLDGVPVVRMGNIVDGRLDLDDLKFLPNDHDEFPALLLADGDLLFNRTNSPELVGKTAIARTLPEECSFASYIIRVRFAAEMLPEFVSYFINSPFGRRWVRDNVSQQVGQANVNGTKLRALTVPVPPTSVQENIVGEVTRLFAVGDDLRKSLDAAVRDAEVLERSLLYNAVSGRLVSPKTSAESGSELLIRIRAKRTKSRVRRERSAVRPRTGSKP